MTSLPTILYKSPGPFVGPPVDGKGTTFATLGVATEDALRDGLADGWCLTLPEAVAPRAVAAPAPSPAPAAPIPAPAVERPAAPILSGRAALLARAEAVGLRVDGRWSEKRLEDELAKLKG